MLDHLIYNKIYINNSNKAADVIMQEIIKQDVENLIMLFLDSNNGLISIDSYISPSAVKFAFDPGDVVKKALVQGAKSVIIGHNHPATNVLVPSKDDIATTKHLAQAFSLVNITLLDHLIVGNGRHFSFNDFGMIDQYN